MNAAMNPASNASGMEIATGTPTSPIVTKNPNPLITISSMRE